MSWEFLEPNDVPNSLEISEAVATGELEAIGPLVPEDIETYTRTQYESRIRHKDMSGSGLASNDVMNRGEMIAWADYSPRVPGSFTATHNNGYCPTIVIDLSWSNIGRSEQKALERYNPTLGAWEFIANPSAASTSYRDDSGQARPGSNRYRIRFASEVQWATRSVIALC